MKILRRNASFPSVFVVNYATCMEIRQPSVSMSVILSGRLNKVHLRLGLSWAHKCCATEQQVITLLKSILVYHFQGIGIDNELM
jgi:hypothetical protein